MVCVPDCSVAVKWLVPEERSGEAFCLLADSTRGILTLHVPDFFLVEVSNVIWKKGMRGELAAPDTQAILRRLLTAPLALHSSAELLPRALTIAVECRRTVYDSLYVALAESLGGVMVTDDQRLVNALQPTPFKRLVRWLGETAGKPPDAW